MTTPSAHPSSSSKARACHQPRHDTPASDRLARTVGALGLAALAVTCGGGNGNGARPQPAIPVTVATVVEKVMPLEVKAIGHVEAIASVAVRARIGGELVKVWFEEGQTVATGATLFSIDPRVYEAALRQAEAQLARDQALLKKAQADTARYATLVERDFVTKEQFDQVTANAEALRAAVAADQATVDNARLQVAYCTITAPVAGRTGSLMIKGGNLVKANDNPLVTINQTRPIHVAFSVPAQLLPAVAGRREDGIRVRVTGLPGPQPHEGTLSFIDNAVDPDTSTILLRATFPNADEALWPGQFVTVTMTLGEEPNRVVAPAAAVQTGQQGTYVFVVDNDQTAELRVVMVNRMDEHEAVIDTGLVGGETVVTDGQLRLVPGSKVQPREAIGAAEAKP